ncbi:MAG TPA: DUF962 domain-containing protein [Steroidobacteraceae bacterium]|nr:DUF962 domain-containing protein [Steroidobacteraceae bacterium]
MQTGATRPAGAQYTSFREFYPAYLAEHSARTTRRLHVIGLGVALVLLIVAVVAGRWNLLWVLPVVGYGFAWIGHFVFERNRPATFRHPLYSLMGDFALLRDVLRGRIPF